MIIHNNRNLYTNNKDYIVMLRKEAINLTYQELNDSFVRLIKQDF